MVRPMQSKNADLAGKLAVILARMPAEFEDSRLRRGPTS
jgi:hypothetical protein